MSEDLLKVAKYINLNEIEIREYRIYPDIALDYALNKTLRKVGLTNRKAYFKRVIDQFCMQRGIVLPHPIQETSDLQPRILSGKIDFFPQGKEDKEEMYKPIYPRPKPKTKRTGNAAEDEAFAQRHAEQEILQRKLHGTHPSSDREWMDNSPEDPLYTIHRWEESQKAEHYNKGMEILEPFNLLRIARIIIKSELPNEELKRLFETYPKLHKEVLDNMNYKPFQRK